jgi:hypothetical protein
VVEEEQCGMMDIRWVTHIINDGYMVGYARYEKID